MPERKHQTVKKTLVPKDTSHKNRLKISQTGKELKGHQVTSFATAKKKKRPPKKKA